MDDNVQENEAPLGRRTFFRQAAVLGLDALEQAGRAITHVPGTERPGEPDLVGTDQPVRFLRPPGALNERDFESRCSRCGDCVRACPAECIVIDARVGDGLPHIQPRVSPCVVCDDLSCMKACPTGALTLIQHATEIKMGVATIAHDRCLRSTDVDHPGHGCKECVEQCPIGEDAIRVVGDDHVSIEAGCIGCGVCERVCPTEPASIWVVPSHQPST